MAVPKTGVFRRKSVLPRRADEAEAVVVVPVVGVVVVPVRDGTVCFLPGKSFLRQWPRAYAPVPTLPYQDFPGNHRVTAQSGRGGSRRRSSCSGCRVCCRP